ncbi:MAG: acetate kinase [Pseudomonadota bacterium]
MMLVVNAGSSSIKFALFDAGLTETLSGAVTEIGPEARLEIAGQAQKVAARTHDAAIHLILAALSDHGHPVTGLTAAAHRVVHGGTAFTGTVRVTPEVIAAIEAQVPLAPLHNPHNLSPILALQARAPALPQVAGFDTAFHATIPDVAQTYALPLAERDRGLRRYGFHGISYAGLTETLRARGDLPDRLLALHLGNGASACAIRDGRSVASTMGYSPTSGLTMGTRSGDIDPMVVLDLATRHGIDGAADLLNRQSGLKGLGGHSDMRALHATETDEARFAIDHFVQTAIRQCGSLIAAMGGLEAIAFTGGIGENDAVIQDRITRGLLWAGAVPVHIVPAEEERTLARDALALLQTE